MNQLYVIAVPIGNPKDISLRAIETLAAADALICEEYRSGSSLLKSLELQKPLHLLNEHSSKEDVRNLFHELFIDRNGSYALISDAGTPCFADPGADLVQLCQDYNIPVTAIPGASSLMTAIMLSGKKTDSFLYYGFLPANKEERIKALKQIKSTQTCDYYFLEAPYRLKQVLKDISLILGTHKRMTLFYRLTYPDERVIKSTAGELYELSEQLNKGEFILLLEK